MDKPREKHEIIAEYLLGDTSTRKLANEFPNFALLTSYLKAEGLTTFF